MPHENAIAESVLAIRTISFESLFLVLAEVAPGCAFFVSLVLGRTLDVIKRIALFPLELELDRERMTNQRHREAIQALAALHELRSQLKPFDATTDREFSDQEKALTHEISSLKRDVEDEPDIGRPSECRRKELRSLTASSNVTEPEK